MLLTKEDRTVDRVEKETDMWGPGHRQDSNPDHLLEGVRPGLLPFFKELNLKISDFFYLH